ncbi:MAG TPA: DUF1802 family protein [Abditibacteriaceae bacterium]|jgi:hypothetical protein
MHTEKIRLDDRLEETVSCDVALKEWSATCLALAEGRQILLLRKGGIHDDVGAFQLEQSQFWLQPTYIHQGDYLVKPEWQDVLQRANASQQPDENEKFIVLRHFARVEHIWQMTPDRTEAERLETLRRARHMWSDDYLQLRLDFKPQHPLLCVALRVWTCEETTLPMRSEFLGCRSWIDLPQPLTPQNARAALDDDAFASQMEELRAVFES